MKKILLLLFTLIFTFVAFAKKTENTDVAAMKERERLIASIEETLNRDTVLGKLNQYFQAISKGDKDGEPLRAIMYTVYASSIDAWVKYRWLIADTGLSRKWLKSVHALFAYLGNNKRILDAAKFNGRLDMPQAKLALKYQAQAYERLAELLKKPVSVSSKVRRKAKLDKAIWQKAMRKKYKIKDKPSMDDF